MVACIYAGGQPRLIKKRDEYYLKANKTLGHITASGITAVQIIMIID